LSKVSVITVVKNDGVGLMATYESLISQTYENWELIIVAAHSEDETVELAEHLTTLDERIQLNLREAGGIYDAMNFGLSRIKGSYVWFMNAADTFAAVDVIEDAVEQIELYKTNLIIGGYEVHTSLSNRAYPHKDKAISRLGFAFSLRMCHQSMLFSAEIFSLDEKYRTTYRYASDFDLILRILDEGSARTRNKIYSRFKPGGSADQNLISVFSEKHKSRIENFGSFPILLLSLAWTAAARFKHYLKFLRVKANT
jgi:glycosyltransferase involved in cell wall biosynthesis